MYKLQNTYKLILITAIIKCTSCGKIWMGTIITYSKYGQSDKYESLFPFQHCSCGEVNYTTVCYLTTSYQLRKLGFMKKCSKCEGKFFCATNRKAEVGSTDDIW